MAGSALRVAVAGSGPGGMYCVKYLLKSALGARLAVDVLERLPTAYGLVRYGVAPDHPDVKSVSNDFDAVLGDARVRFLGNVEVGRRVNVARLLSRYDAVVLAYGASSDRELGCPGERGASNIWGAREFVNWYNGHPDMAGRAPPLLDCEEAVVVGQGNVALDCARVLAKSADELRATDISPAALAVLAQSRLRHISVVGRRGHVQAAFTIKELRELTKLAGAGCSVREAELALGRTPASQVEAAERARKRLVELIDKTAAPEAAAAAAAAARVVELRFLLSPAEVLADAAGRVSGLVCLRNLLSGEAHAQHPRPAHPREQHTLPCGLLIRSIGYRSEPLLGVPFDQKTATVKHHLGRVDGVAGLYASGWLKRGPSGIIGTNINCARETVDAIVEDLQSPTYSPKPDTGDLPELAQGDPVVDWTALQRLDAHELALGAKQGRARVKVLDAAEQIRVALGREP